MVIRKILAKLISRVGLPQVKSATTKEHQKLIAYIEREKRKRVNAKERVKLLALMGQEAAEDDQIDMNEEQQGSESEGENNEHMTDRQKGESDSESDDSEASDEEATLDNQNGKDRLAGAMLPYQIDIPMSRNIPVVSTLAKQMLKEDKKKQSRLEKQHD